MQPHTKEQCNLTYKNPYKQNLPNISKHSPHDLLPFGCTTTSGFAGSGFAQHIHVNLPVLLQDQNVLAIVIQLLFTSMSLFKKKYMSKFEILKD
jgi:hypothetical protein